MAEIKKFPAIRFKSDLQEWDEKTLLELSENGFTNGVFNDPTKPGGRYKLVNVLDMYIDSTIDEKRLNFVDIGEAEFTKNKVENGDVFFTRSSLVKEGIAHSNTYLGNSQDITFDGHLIRMRPKKDLINSCFLNYLLKTSHVRKQLVQRGKTATMTTIGQADIAPVSVIFPKSKDEQTQIGSYLQHLDKLISLHQAKVNKLTNLKKAMLEKMFPKQDADVPEIRFKGFEKAWDEKTVGGIFDDLKGTGLSKEKIGNQGKYKCILYGHLFTKFSEVIDEIDSRTDYYEGVLSKENDILMPSSTTTTGIDLAKASSLKESGVLLGGDIIILRMKELGSSDFFAYYLTNGVSKKIAEVTQGTTIIHLYFSGLKDVLLKVPCPAEQALIGAYFQNLDKAISLHQTELEKLGNLKKACLEKMFV